MIYTITANPAVDVVYQIDKLQVGALNRSQVEAYVAGGKGINVSTLLASLGLPSIATGFVAGFTGAFIRDKVESLGIRHAFIEVAGMTRINAKINNHSDVATEVNGNGPMIEREDMVKLCTYLKDHLQAKDTLVLAGNKAHGMKSEDYQNIGEICLAAQADFILDSNQSLLADCLVFKPYLIKPNRQELAEITGYNLNDERSLYQAGKLAQQRGAKNIIISCGGDGAYLLTEDGSFYYSTVPAGQVVNPTGAGDSMIAGYLYGKSLKADEKACLKWATAAGSATAYTAGIANFELVKTLYPNVRVKVIN